jgi:hypothetical protein
MAVMIFLAQAVMFRVGLRAEVVLGPAQFFVLSAQLLDGLPGFLLLDSMVILELKQTLF